MSDNRTKVIITGEDRTKAAFGSINRQMGDIKKNATKIAGEMRLVNDAVKTMVGLLSLGAIKNFVGNAISEFNKAEAGFRGLEAVANRSGVGIGRAMQEAERLSADGLISLQDAQKGLQNLLSRGYDLSQATSTIEALKNSAVSGRQASLSLSEAVVNATEGLKNENSILVDNAGVTKNVSVLWKEYAAQIGKTTAELTQQDKIQAEVSGIMRETAAFTGAAADAANTLQGQMAKLAVEQQKVSAQMGQALMPAMVELSRGGIVLIQDFLKPVIYFAQNLGISFAAAGDKVSAFWRLLKTRDLASYRDEVERINAQLRESREDARAALDVGLQFTPNPNTGGTGGGSPDAGATASPAASKAAASKAARERKAAAGAELALRAEQSEQAARLEQDDLARQIAVNKQAFDDKLIDANDYYAALTELQRQQAASEIAALTAQRAAAEAIRGSDADRIKAQAVIVKIAAEIELVERRVAAEAIANARARVAVNTAAVKSAQDLIDSIEQEAVVLGLTNDERARALALLQLEALAVNLTADEYQKLGAALNAALDSRESADARKVALEAAQKQSEDIRTALTENLQRSLADVLNSGFTGDGARGAIQGFVDLLRTSLSNVIAAGLTESIMSQFSGGALDSFGSFFGLGGGKKGETIANPLYVKDVAAGAESLLPGAEKEGGVLGGLGETFSNMFSGLGNMMSGLFSSLMSGLTSLMSGIGGGMSGMLSGIGSLFGFADGGYTGPGGKYQPAGVVHAGEYVFSADSVRRLGLGALDNLHRIAKGSMIPRGARMGYAEGGLVNLPGSAAPSVTSNTKIVNLFDIESAMSEYLNTRGGERSILNVIQRNPGAAGA